MALTLPWDRWPDVDQQTWTTLFTNGGPLDDRGALAHVRPTTRTSLERAYSRWLKWVQDRAPEVLAQPPSMRVQAARLQDWLADLAHTSPMTRRTFVDAVLRIARAIDEDRDWTPELALQRGLRARASRDHGSRKRGRILSSEVLFDAGRRLVEEEAPKVAVPLFRATALRDGAMIGLLALMPMRRRAFTGLRIGASFLPHAEGFSIALPGTLTKSGLPWEAEVPDPAADLLRIYLRDARPMLAARASDKDDHLWIGRTGHKFGEDHLRTLISNGVERITGIPVSPHLFRDAAATTLARHSPDAATLVQPLLAHTCGGVAERHYIHATSIDAGRNYAKVLRRLRGDA